MSSLETLSRHPLKIPFTNIIKSFFRFKGVKSDLLMVYVCKECRGYPFNMAGCLHVAFAQHWCLYDNFFAPCTKSAQIGEEKRRENKHYI